MRAGARGLPVLTWARRQETTVTMPIPSQPVHRRDALKGELLHTWDLLKSRRASEIAPATIDDYVALDWLEWNGGTLLLTVIGDNIRKQLTAARA